MRPDLKFEPLYTCNSDIRITEPILLLYSDIVSEHTNEDNKKSSREYLITELGPEAENIIVNHLNSCRECDKYFERFLREREMLSKRKGKVLERRVS